jgi:pimeloyl-ACP methyl ester carboxylesterase/class 3 adenylate cyclase
VLPDTQYAKSGDVHIAYQVFGEGPIDLVQVPGSVSHLDLMWEDSGFARYYRRLANFARVIVFDKRGTGLSDRAAGIATLEERMDDVRAVMDAVGSQQAAIIGLSEGGSMSILFAATYPERTRGLVLYGSNVTGRGDEDFPWAPFRTDEEIRKRLDETPWDSADQIIDALASGAPSVAHDPAIQQWWLRMRRAGASPAATRALAEMNFLIDVRPVLPSIRTPTLVINLTEDRWVPIEAARYIAARIPAAKLAEIPGTDHVFVWQAVEPVVAEIEEFLTGVRPAPEPERVLATVLFTDIVGSTEKASAMGDQRWRDLLARHHAVVRRQLQLFRGREIDTTGDGFLATFDGPARGVRCASAIIEETRQIGVDIRAGLHTGEIEIVGNDVAGIAVHIGQRVSALAGPCEVLVSRTVTDLVAGSGLAFEQRGEHELKGVPGRWQLYAVTS